ncbi:MAG: hypothetical protein J6K74_04600 [Marinifilaceae bacterium]|nr:hypothetical protein [Marinifilaceae bacterium]
MKDNKKLTTLLITICILSIISCTSKKDSVIKTLSKDFPKSIELKGEVFNISSDSLDDCEKMKIVNNYLMILSSTTDKLVTAININDFRVYRLIDKGRGPNEFINQRFCDSDNAFVISQDFSFRDNSIRYGTIIVPQDTPVFKEYRLKIKDTLTYGAEVILSHNHAVYFPFTNRGEYQYMTNRVAIFNEEGDLLKTMGDMTSLVIPGEREKEVRFRNFSGNYAKTPNSNNFAFASKTGTYIEFYDYDKQSTLHRIYGYSKYDISYNENGAILSTSVSADCEVGFIDITASETTYYALYMGVQRSELKNLSVQKLDYKGSDIYTYSKEGKPLKHLHLDREVRKIAASPDGKYLYGWSNNPETYEVEIVRYSL